MSYPTYDTSLSLGSPSELYRFNYEGTAYRYCSLDGGAGDFAYAVGSGLETFTPTTIDHGSLTASEEMSRNSIDITVPSTFPVALLFLYAPPEGAISVTIFRFHVNDPDKGYITSFKGRVMSCAFRGDEATLTCEPIFTSLRRPGLRMTYEPQCPYRLYDANCTVQQTAFQVDGSVIGMAGEALTVSAASAYADGWFTGGVFQSDSVRRMIVGNSGATVTLMHPAPATVLGKPCFIWPGCAHTRGDCGSKFNNAVNYGGFPWMPLKNPFTGDSIFW